MVAKTVQINGEDFTADFVPQFDIRQVRVQGPNGFPVSNGDTIVDLLTTKDEISYRVQPLSTVRLRALRAVMKNAYVNLYYFDPDTGNYRTIEAIPSEVSATYKGQQSDGADLWTVQTVSFRER